MKLALLVLSLALSGCVVAQPAVVRSASVRTVVTVDTFDPYLSPYGEWLDVPGYGRVWQPGLGIVGSNFSPYGTHGRWLLSDAGWVFDSDLPFGWAVFHYGRWFRDPFRGWCWFPGDQWAPAWVSWRMGGPYIGWAPIGPFGAPQFHGHSWTFVEAQRFLGYNVSSYALPPSRFHHAVALTQPMQGSVTGPPPAYVSRATQQPIAPVPVGRVHAGAPVPPPPPGRERPSLLPPPPGARTSPGLGQSTRPSQQERGAPPPPGWGRRAPPGASDPRQEGALPPPPPGFGRRSMPGAPAPRPEPGTPLPPPGFGRSTPSFQRDRERLSAPSQWRAPAPPPPPPSKRSSPSAPPPPVRRR